MATTISEAYDAFLAAGAPEDKARKAAEALSNYDQRFDRADRDILKVQAEQVLLKWMVDLASPSMSPSSFGCFSAETLVMPARAQERPTSRPLMLPSIRLI